MLSNHTRQLNRRATASEPTGMFYDLPLDIPSATVAAKIGAF
jgi:hypothetical protein